MEHDNKKQVSAGMTCHKIFDLWKWIDAFLLQVETY